MSRAGLQAARIAELSDHFEDYIAVFDLRPPFNRRDQLASHERTIELRRSLGAMSAVLDADEFVESLWMTLRAWGIGIRGSRILDVPALKVELARHRNQLMDLETVQLGRAEPAIEDRVWMLVDGLDITPNKARLVSITKTLHHLLPDLVPPIDRAYTGAFFAWSPFEFQDRQEEVFRMTWRGFTVVAQAVDVARLVDGTPWHTSTTKVIDNAIVGYCLHHELAGTPRPRSPRYPRPMPNPRADRGPWNATELLGLLSTFEAELRKAGLKENTIQTYVGRSATFVRWLEGTYQPRGPNQ